MKQLFNFGLITLFVVVVFVLVGHTVSTAHRGHLRKQLVYIEKPKIDWANPPKLERNHNLKAVIDGDTVNYYAASATRCDELYKYLHFIGKGHITGSKEIVNFYNPNDDYRLITVDQMLAEKK